MDMLTAELWPGPDYNAPPRPACILIGGDSPDREQLAAAVARCGGRVAAQIACDGAAEAAVLPGALILDARHDSGALLDAALDMVEAASLRGRPCLVVATLHTIDVVAAHIRDGGLVQLAESGSAPLDEAIDRLLAASGSSQVREGDDSDRRKLEEMREEVGRVARHLAALAGRAFPEQAGSADGSPDRSMIRAILRLRRLREQFFTPELFADPAWDILLDLAGAEGEQRAVAVSSLCIAAAVPPTTALRWISTMTDRGLLVRRSDPRDGRRAFIAMSDDTSRAMFAYLAAASRIMAPVS